jgi:hypothetical protein
MEKIFFFIIIMIISSLLSKNKKKRVTSYTKKEKTTYFDGKGKPANDPKPVTDLKGFLDRMKKVDSYMPEPQTSEPEAKEEYVPEPVEVQQDYKRSPEKSMDEMLSGEWKIPEREETKLQSENREEDESYSIKVRVNRHRNLLNTRQKLKDAIIVSEILNRRYT